MNGCTVQRYWIVPGLVSLSVNDPPLPKVGEGVKAGPDVPVTLCAALSALTQWTDWPTRAWITLGVKAKFDIWAWIVPPAGAGGVAAPTWALALELALLLEVTVEALGLELDPHPARATAAAIRVGRRIRMSPAYPRHGLLESPDMSGHSKWASIKHKKAVVDARRGQHFTKLTRAITVAAREGGGDPDGNPALALAIQKARDASMPKDNIERAIAKGTGEGVDADRFESVLYEAYGPGGVALLIEALTDNRNRTGADLRHLLGKHGGNLGEPGSVSYLFDKQGLILVDAARYGEDDLMAAIDAGALDIVRDDDVYEVITEPADLTPARAALREAGVEIESADLAQRPKVRVPVEEADAARLMKLIDGLEELDDVGAVHANFEVDAAVLERIAS
jgi:YebC/PmpR family DNA-binding regulatory protein